MGIMNSRKRQGGISISFHERVDEMGDGQKQGPGELRAGARVFTIVS